MKWHENILTFANPGLQPPFYNGLLKSFLAVDLCKTDFLRDCEYIRLWNLFLRCPAELESDWKSFNGKNCVENATGWLDKDQKLSVLVFPYSWEGRDFLKIAEMAWNRQWSLQTTSATLQAHKNFFICLCNFRRLYGFLVLVQAVL